MVVTFIPLISYKRPDLWLSTRAYTLAFYMLTITFFDYSVPYIDSVVKQQISVITIWGVINLALHIVYAIWWFRGGRKTFREKYAPAGL
jgi:hypothetical protein